MWMWVRMEHECTHENKFELIDKRLNKLETNMATLKARVDKKHDEILSLHDNFVKEQDELISMIRAVTELAAIQKEQNRDTKENRKQIDVLNVELASQQSELKTYKKLVSGVVATFAGVLVAIILEGLGL